jgi:hypothetical protein
MLELAGPDAVWPVYAPTTGANETEREDRLMSKRKKRESAEQNTNPPPAAKVDSKGSSPVPLVIFAFALPLLLLTIGMYLMNH